MTDCNEIDAALSRLSEKIDGLGNRLNELDRKQKECCDNKNKNQQDDDLSELKKRWDAIERYINKSKLNVRSVVVIILVIGDECFGDRRS